MTDHYKPPRQQPRGPGWAEDGALLAPPATSAACDWPCPPPRVCPKCGQVHDVLGQTSAPPAAGLPPDPLAWRETAVRDLLAGLARDGFLRPTTSVGEERLLAARVSTIVRALVEGEVLAALGTRGTGTTNSPEQEYADAVGHLEQAIAEGLCGGGEELTDVHGTHPAVAEQVAPYVIAHLRSCPGDVELFFGAPDDPLPGEHRDDRSLTADQGAAVVEVPPC